MKKLIMLISIAFVANIMFAQEQIKIMTFNIHAGIDTPIEKIAEFIQAEKPDIIAIQEIEFYTDRSKLTPARLNNNNEDMITKLAYLCSMQGMFYPAISVHGGKFGNAILSRFPLERTENIPLPYVANTEQRVASVCDIRLQSGKIFTFICTHLDMANQDNGMNQIKKINELGKEASYPVILAGDLNKRVGTTHIDELNTTWNLSLSNEFDHIAQLSNNKFDVIDTKIYTGNTLSDHLPIMVTFELK